MICLSVIAYAALLIALVTMLNLVYRLEAWWKREPGASRTDLTVSAMLSIGSVVGLLYVIVAHI